MVFVLLGKNHQTKIMGPKYQLIRAPPKKAEAYRLNLNDDLGNVELKSSSRVSQHSGMTRKNSKRNIDQMSRTILTRHRKKNRKAEDFNTSLIDKLCPVTVDQNKCLTKSYSKPSNTHYCEILGEAEVLDSNISKQLNSKNMEPKNVNQNVSETDSNVDRNTTNQVPNNDELEIDTASRTDTPTVLTEDQMISNVCVIKPILVNASTVLSFDESSCHSIETGHYNVIENETTVILREIAKMHDSLATIIKMQRKLYNSHEEVKKEFQSFKDQNSAYENREKWLAENGINLPMESMEEFTVYNVLIKQSSECRKILETSVHFAVNGKKSLTKNIAAVVRKYFTGELASQFTAIKSVKGKVVLAETFFYKHMLRNFLEKSIVGILPSGLTESDFNRALGEVLCNAKDWNKSRLRKTVEC